MTILRYDETDRFWARDDNGDEYEIVEVTEILDDSTSGKVGATVSGMRFLHTTTGRHVNQRGEEYEILADGLEPTVSARRLTQAGGTMETRGAEG